MVTVVVSGKKSRDVGSKGLSTSSGKCGQQRHLGAKTGPAGTDRRGAPGWRLLPVCGIGRGQAGGVWRSGVQQRQRTDAPPPTGRSGCQTARGRIGGGGGLGSLTPGLRACLVLRTSTSGWCGLGQPAVQRGGRTLSVTLRLLWLHGQQSTPSGPSPLSWPPLRRGVPARESGRRDQHEMRRHGPWPQLWGRLALVGLVSLAGVADASKIDSHPP